MKLALHIGTTKTGTTTLQRWVLRNRDGLRAQGIHYPDSLLKAESHKKLMFYARDSDKPDASFAAAGIRSPEDHAAFRASLRLDFLREFTDNRNDRAWLVSSEHLHTKLSSLAMVERVRDLFTPCFSDITVYVHLRPQVDLLVSNASQRARMGREVTRAELARSAVGPGSSYFNYNKIVELWEKVFGAGNLRVVPFRRIPDITGQLITELGIDPAPLGPVTHENEALDWRAIALANVLNRQMQVESLPVPPEFYLNSMPGVERLRIGRALAEEIQGRFSKSNAALVARRSDITADDLVPDWTDHDGAANLHLLEAPCVFGDQIGHLVRRFTQELALERYRRHLAEVRLAIQQGRPDAVRSTRAEVSRLAAELASWGTAPPETLQDAPTSA